MGKKYMSVPEKGLRWNRQDEPRGDYSRVVTDDKTNLYARRSMKHAREIHKLGLTMPVTVKVTCSGGHVEHTLINKHLVP
jgi:hypothetical protein